MASIQERMDISIWSNEEDFASCRVLPIGLELAPNGLINLKPDPTNWHNWEPWNKQQCSHSSVPLPTILGGINEKADWLSYDIPFKSQEHEPISISKITEREPASLSWTSPSPVDWNTSIFIISSWLRGHHAIKKYWNLQHCNNAAHAHPYLSQEHAQAEKHSRSLFYMFSVTAPKTH
tara:strand:- start:150 stop:683 length:534 start_codon:yes stop_codon:yes gene_type:complete